MRDLNGQSPKVIIKMLIAVIPDLTEARESENVGR